MNLEHEYNQLKVEHSRIVGECLALRNEVDYLRQRMTEMLGGRGVKPDSMQLLINQEKMMMKFADIIVQQLQSQ